MQHRHLSHLSDSPCGGMIHCRNKTGDEHALPTPNERTAAHNVGTNRSDDRPTIYLNVNLHAMNGCDLALAKLSHHGVLLTLHEAIYRSR